MRAARAVDRAAQARGRARGLGDGARRRGRSRTWARRCGWCPRRAGAGPPPRRRAARPAATRARRSSAGTGARRGSRSRRGWTPPPPAPARPTPADDRGQRTRWASRSSSGGMSFNWRLLLAPPEILDYVVEHEVAHIEVMDHSPRFWRLLASRSPRLARALRVAEALRSDAHAVSVRRSAANGLSPSRARGVRRIRPVQATAEPSPCTSSPPRTPALELDPRATRSPRLVAAADEVHGLARARGLRASPPGSIASPSVSRLSFSIFGPRRTVNW